jgi:radical SAM protein with 4Fe4S-binding SPASM domain
MLYPYFPFSLNRKKASNYVVSSPYGTSEVNDAAAAILRLCNGSRSTETIASALQKHYTAPPSELYSRIETFLAILSAKGLVWLKNKPMRWFNAPAPPSIFWEITSRCNLLCRHCVVASSDAVSSSELSTERSLELIDEWAHTGVRDITFSGGEPLLRKDFFDLASAAKQRNLELSLATNGTLITPSVARNLKNLGFDVQISLDGSTPDIYESVRGNAERFKDVIAGIHNLLSEKVNLTIGTVLTRNNVDDIPDILELVEKMGAPAFRIIPFIPSGRGRENRALELDPAEMRKVYADLVEKRASVSLTILPLEFECTFSSPSADPVDPSRPVECGGAIHYCTVTPTGEILPCHYFEGLVTDSVQNRPFMEVWQQSRFLNYFRSIEIGDIDGCCRQCGWLSECCSGCRATNFSNRDLFGSNHHCWIVKENQMNDIQHPE